MSTHEKTKLHNRVTGLGWPRPELEYLSFPREPAAQQWLCIVRINKGEWGRAYGPSRQAASEAAATVAYDALTRAGY
ncbi:uncharacterized protein SCHCODRAFT_02748523 [Schizophyllum commune H4-8]|nr:uncharacterized protein SCHCODRAFT_02748523 [Schizophyllum commune H4-8]KAI5892257.1 hypothetical protein SCHCODRAFT_02748523 [Schizophyllum commune H4-8]